MKKIKKGIKPATHKPNAGIAKAVKAVTKDKRVPRAKKPAMDKHGVKPNLKQMGEKAA